MPRVPSFLVVLLVSVAVVIFVAVTCGEFATSQQLRASAGPRRLASSASSRNFGPVAYFVGQIIFGFVFHALVTTKYPECLAPTDNSKAIMEEGAACRISLGPICMQSWCCIGPTIGHVLDRTAVCGYWPALICGTCFPMCTIFYATNMSEMNVKLGGQKRELVDGLGVACCCSCCEVARGIEALDAATGSTMGCLSFSGGSAEARGVPMNSNEMSQSFQGS